MAKYFYILLFSILSLLSCSNHDLSCHRAKSETEKKLIECITQSYYKRSEKLLNSGISPNITDYYNRSLLMIALRNEDEKLVNLLLFKGADVNYTIKQQYDYGTTDAKEIMKAANNLTPLLVAVNTGNTSMVNMLLKNGAIINPKDEQQNPLRQASLNLDYKMLDYLSKHDAKISDETAINTLAQSIANTNKYNNLVEPIVRTTDFWVSKDITIQTETFEPFLLNAPKDKRNQFKNSINDFIQRYNNKEKKIRYQSPKNPIIEEKKIKEEERIAKLSEEGDSILQKEKLSDIILKVVLYIIIIICLLLVSIWVYIKLFVIKKTSMISCFTKIIVRFHTLKQKVRIPVPKSHHPKKQDIDRQDIDKGWVRDNTIKIKVDYLTIEDVINPIPLCNEHEKAVRQMMWYMRRLENHSDEQIAKTLGNFGLTPHLKSLWVLIDPSLVRNIYKQSLYLIVQNYGQRDKRVLRFLGIMKKNWNKSTTKNTTNP